jgi:DNA-binding response OmpR family regulator
MSSGEGGGPSATAASAAGHEQQRQRRILVVEDDAAILRQIEFNLQSHGYAVETATTGIEAIKAMMARRPDLLITDVMMPEMDGHELAMSVRADPELKDVPIIMLTARTQDEDMMQGYQSGTDLYLTKPFNLDELVTFVRRIVG